MAVDEVCFIAGFVELELNVDYLQIEYWDVFDVIMRNRFNC